MMDNLELGQTIAKLRKNKNYTIKQLSEITNVTSSMLSQIERGLSSPSLNTLRVIADALDVPLFSLFTEFVPTKDLITRANSRKKNHIPIIEQLGIFIIVSGFKRLH
ncbi:helix-turn-helix domain-containing protein [Paenibacillus sp. DMB20]|uniref:helix-turn-helix domain-containing protein n=1 Tax=Paenibacillus sp. DMB20 TaxID=1642570 RepID=UPI000A8E2E9F|nr:helix-turn-helix transcriptional regulator [Paenibacillus sp. DMB20]